MKTIKTPDTIKVAIADDHQLFCAGVRTSLSFKKDIQIVAEAYNGKQLLDQLQQVTPDVVLLDIQMPVMDGFETLQEINKRYPNIKVIMLSVFNERSMITRMLDAGANSYLTKESAIDLVYDAIRGCHEREFYFTTLINNALVSGMRHKREQAIQANKELLTEKEKAVLRLMCQEKTTREIASLVATRPRTIAAIRDRLKQKIGVKTIAGLAVYAVRQGYLEEEDNS